ncbi:MAG: class I tRNA ligase family protein [Patescibacteria group bacterium]
MRDELGVLGFWTQKKIFEKSIRQRARKAKRFVFFEGPPTANGMPGLHHVEARAFKDVVARYKTMQGFLVERRAGWDTHGLPVEIGVEKALGFKLKQDIEAYGIEPFNRKCKESVWSYTNQWEKVTERMGYWLDTKDAYVTYKNSYIESLWWIVKEFASRKLLYQDDKVVPWCARCGTALSSHELAQGYKKVKDPSVYVRFRLKTRRASLLVWTTTPWTLPANVAAAVHPDLEYVTVDDRGEQLIVLGSLAAKLFPGLEPLWREPGSKLLGLEYDAPYPAPDIPYRVVSGTFITDQEGTGIVHIAPAFGDDDLKVGKREGLPTYVTVNDAGQFTDAVPQWRGIFVKEADPLIVKDLIQKGLLFKEALYEHDYPFCWRCDTPLIYRVRKSWWVKVSAVRPKMVEANKSINWHPQHLRDGRFGQWLREDKDWAFSRERYWGTPLPVWTCKECGHVDVIGSLAELTERAPKSSNTYYLMRHGFAKNNLLGIATAKLNDSYGLLPRGKTEVKKAAAGLKKAGIQLIVSSDLTRTRETAAILARELRVPVLFDADLREHNPGDYEGELVEDMWKKHTAEEILTHPFPGGESWADVKIRSHRFFQRLESLHKKKKILVVGHGDPLWFLEGIMRGMQQPDEISPAKYLKNADVHRVAPVAVPRNKLGETDLHKPFIDDFLVTCPGCLTKMDRTPEVADVWFDSGAMPFAAEHYPFENKERIDKGIAYPADFISEAIDQTRGWFYTLLAVSTLLGKKAPYKNVISLGHLLDKEGKKMSKSRGNVVEPMDLFEKYSADAVRWFFFTINQPGDSKLFDVSDLEKAKRNFIDLFLNTLNFYEMYKPVAKKTSRKNALDLWMEAKCALVSAEVTRRMDAYDVVGAARLIEDFVGNDISRWYVRRSRERMRSGEGVKVLRKTLLQTAILAAPFIPFTAEIVYRAAGGKRESVHLEDWPKKQTYNKALVAGMDEVRALAARGLELRARNGIKVRQPLGALFVKGMTLRDSSLLNILKEELNVKEITVNRKLTEDAALDLVITPTLKEEGEVRELIRFAQDARKKAGLLPLDTVVLVITGSFSPAALAVIKKGTRAKHLEVSDTNKGPSVVSVEKA